MLTPIQMPPLEKEEFDPKAYFELYSFCVDTVSEFDTANMEVAEVSGWPNEYRPSICLKTLFYATRHINTYHDISVRASRDMKIILKKNGLTFTQMKLYRNHRI